VATKRGKEIVTEIRAFLGKDGKFLNYLLKVGEGKYFPVKTQKTRKRQSELPVDDAYCEWRNG